MRDLWRQCVDAENAPDRESAEIFHGSVYRNALVPHPPEGIVQEVPNADLVRGNPGFSPMTGRIPGAVNRGKLVMP